MEEKETKKEKALEETREMKKDIKELQEDIDEIQESVKEVRQRSGFHVFLLTCAIILLFVVFALYGFATGVGYGVGKVKDVNQSSNNVTFENVDIEDVVNIYNNLQPMWLCDSPYFTDSKFTVNDITNEMAYTIGFKNIGYDPKEFTAEELDTQIDSILGKGYKFSHKTYETCPYYKYSNGNYTLAGDGCGGTCGPNNIEKIVGAVKNGNELDIYVAVLFENDKEDKNGDTIVEYYKDYNHKEKVTNYAKEKDDTAGIAEDSVENAKLGTTYKMIFNLENDNYVFVSSEPMK